MEKLKRIALAMVFGFLLTSCSVNKLYVNENGEFEDISKKGVDQLIINEEISPSEQELESICLSFISEHIDITTNPMSEFVALTVSSLGPIGFSNVYLGYHNGSCIRGIVRTSNKSIDPDAKTFSVELKNRKTNERYIFAEKTGFPWVSWPKELFNPVYNEIRNWYLSVDKKY